MPNSEERDVRQKLVFVHFFHSKLLIYSRGLLASVLKKLTEFECFGKQ